jgi:hypothetical protein
MERRANTIQRLLRIGGRSTLMACVNKSYPGVKRPQGHAAPIQRPLPLRTM